MLCLYVYGEEEESLSLMELQKEKLERAASVTQILSKIRCSIVLAATQTKLKQMILSNLNRLDSFVKLLIFS